MSDFLKDSESGHPIRNGFIEFTTWADFDEDLSEEEDDEPIYCQWLYNGNNYQGTGKVTIVEKLKPGFYSIAYNNENRLVAVPEKIDTDKIYRLSDDKVLKIVNEVSRFWNKKELFEKEGISHKRGILLVGPPGTGKSTLINIISVDLIKHGGIVFHIKSTNDLKVYINFMKLYFRQIEPERPIITIIEDIDKIVAMDESLLLNFLDGADQLNHNITLATSNRFNDLNDLVLRPSRFDWIVEIGLPTDQVRREFLEKKGMVAEELDLWISKTNKFSLAEIKELFIAVKLLENDLDETVEKIREQSASVSHTTFTSSKRKTAGF